MRELEVLRKLNEADKEDRYHILQLYRTFTHHNHMCLVFENLRFVAYSYPKFPSLLSIL